MRHRYWTWLHWANIPFIYFTSNAVGPLGQHAYLWAIGANFITDLFPPLLTVLYFHKIWVLFTWLINLRVNEAKHVKLIFVENLINPSCEFPTLDFKNVLTQRLVKESSLKLHFQIFWFKVMVRSSDDTEGCC